MHIALLQVSISLPEARSLKDKRMVLRSLKDRVRNGFNVSMAEVDRQDEWRFADLAFVTVAAEKPVVEKRVSELQSLLTSTPRFVVMRFHTDWL